MDSDATAQLLALITSVFYASALVSARAGMRYSTPTTVTLVSILMQNLLLWSAVFATGGVHAVPLVGILLFTLVGIFQLGVRLLAYTGVEKIGASRSSALQSVSPLISATIAISVLGEHASLLIILGTTDSRAPQGFAPLAIGLAVALINWAGIPVTNLSLNPARSTATAVFADEDALRLRRRKVEQPRIRQVVVDDDVSFLQPPAALEGEQSRISRSCTDHVNPTGH